ncbi:hypothetical protein DV711_10020 [Motiliproteus coralliicola]|uniref:Uncharacterized protein n=1 Tax=Motiliproteus coralliicola TaxID=2283196 RepID=A0A369WQP6_9GAMM|nr:hypothetical protein [Motiliproteus coralliicola]RDE22886.1 hypothetical protein DV711_10020 [Motiliproteus coralliicola]
MLNYIMENKDWLFSGAGVAVVTLILSFFFKRKSLAEPDAIQNQQVDIKEVESLQGVSPIELTEVEKVAKRFRTTLELMNEGRNYSQFTIPQLAQLMKLHKISELENVFTGRTEPSFSFIEDFCKTFGVCKEWLIEGKGSPYSSDMPSKSDPMDYLSLIEEVNPESIYFVKENTDTAPAFILLKVSKWKYLILSRTWHISDVVGAGGQRQLYSFYNLIKELRDKKSLHTSCWGLTLSKDEFNSLLCGETFPGKYTDAGFSEDPWWDDLTDIDHKYPIAENYEQWHGKSFIKAQEIIKWYMSERKAS